MCRPEYRGKLARLIATDGHLALLAGDGRDDVTGTKARTRLETSVSVRRSQGFLGWRLEVCVLRADGSLCRIGMVELVPPVETVTLADLRDIIDAEIDSDLLPRDPGYRFRWRGVPCGKSNNSMRSNLC